MKKSKKARFFKGDIVRKGKNEYKVEEIQHDENGTRIIIAFSAQGNGVRFFDSDESYIPVEVETDIYGFKARHRHNKG